MHGRALKTAPSLLSGSATGGNEINGESLKRLWLFPLRLIGAVMTIFQSNRIRLGEFKRQRLVAGVLKYGALVTLLLWLVLAMIAGDEGRNRLTESVKQLWPGTAPGPLEDGAAAPAPPPAPGGD